MLFLPDMFVNSLVGRDIKVDPEDLEKFSHDGVLTIRFDVEIQKEWILLPPKPTHAVVNLTRLLEASKYTDVSLVCLARARCVSLKPKVWS